MRVEQMERADPLAPAEQRVAAVAAVEAERAEPLALQVQMGLREAAEQAERVARAALLGSRERLVRRAHLAEPALQDRLVALERQVRAV